MMIQRWKSFLALFGIAIALAVGMTQLILTEPGAANVTPLPHDYAQNFVHYVTVRCPNQQSIREMYINPEAISALNQGEVLPDGTTIAMETRSGNSLNNIFVRRKAGEDWQNAWYSSSGSLVSDSQTSCVGCHARVSDRDYVFTLPALQAASQSGQKQSQETEFSTSVCN